MTNQPAPEDAARITGIVREYQQWSVFWDPKYHLWRAAEDDPDSDLYAESSDAATVIRYITTHSPHPPGRPGLHSRRISTAGTNAACAYVGHPGEADA